MANVTQHFQGCCVWHPQFVLFIILEYRWSDKEDDHDDDDDDDDDDDNTGAGGGDDDKYTDFSNKIHLKVD